MLELPVLGSSLFFLSNQLSSFLPSFLPSSSFFFLLVSFPFFLSSFFLDLASLPLIVHEFSPLSLPRARHESTEQEETKEGPKTPQMHARHWPRAAQPRVQRNKAPSILASPAHAPEAGASCHKRAGRASTGRSVPGALGCIHNFTPNLPHFDEFVMQEKRPTAALNRHPPGAAPPTPSSAPPDWSMAPPRREMWPRGAPAKTAAVERACVRRATILCPGRRGKHRTAPLPRGAEQDVGSAWGAAASTARPSAAVGRISFVDFGANTGNAAIVLLCQKFPGSQRDVSKRLSCRVRYNTF